MRRYVLTASILISAIIGPAAFGATPVEGAVRLAELRVERPALLSKIETAGADFQLTTHSLDLSRDRLNAALAEQALALEQLWQLEDELRATRARFDDGIQQMYIRGGSAALTVVMFFDDPTAAGIATQYLAALSDSETQPMHEAEELLVEMDELKYSAFDAVELADGDHAERERAYVIAAGQLAELEYELERLDNRIVRLTTDWRDYRLSLAQNILETTGASGVLETDTIEQAARRAFLPLGPTIGVPPGLQTTGRTLRGVASWYGPGFHGRRASSGAIFDERDFTIAHKTLPHETLLLVTYGDKQAVVMVNDRGPFIEGRDFDLSRATAEYLGLGLGTISAEILVEAP